MSEVILKSGLHPRSRFRQRYDFTALANVCPQLAAFVKLNAYEEPSIDYADPKAVLKLNQALLRSAYGLQAWDLPPGYLCPPIPGRSDYIHHLADLIGTSQGSAVRVLDVGTGANCIYPLIGACEYGWRFVGSEIDPVACQWARKIVSSNPGVAGMIECRLQKSRLQCFHGIIQPGETFELTMCNPPFHASAAEASAGTERKNKNLGSRQRSLNFGGKANELWCDGGELAFVKRMITQSIPYGSQCRWFTSLVSKSAHLPMLERGLHQAKATAVKIIDMAQGQKKSRILAWTFQPVARL